MATFTTIISIIYLLLLISVPILLFVVIKKWKHVRFNFLAYMISGLLITAGVMWTFSWWVDYSDQLLMSHYGYNFDAMDEVQRFKKVEAKNLEKVKQLEIGFFGIAWPLKAMIAFVFYLPYLLVVYFGGYSIKRISETILKWNNKKDRNRIY